MTYDPDLIDRLVREAREEPVCQCNGTFSRVHNSTRGCNLHSSFGRETQARLDRQRLTAMADQLEAARREVERLVEVHAHAAGVIIDEQLLMRPVVEAADRYVYRGGAVLPLKEAIDAYRAAAKRET